MPNARRIASLNRSQTITTEPTLTDQSGADDTTIATIVRRATVSNMVPSSGKEPQYLDWRNIPTNFADMVRYAKNLRNLRKKLPKELASMTDEQLDKLSYDELKSILEPIAQNKKPDPEPDPKPKEGEKK